MLHYLHLFLLLRLLLVQLPCVADAAPACLYLSIHLQVAPQLQLLAGLPAGGPTWPWQLLQACPSRLHSLHLHLSDGCGTLTVGGGAWRDMEVLAELAVTAGPYTTLTLEAPLPPALRQLGAQAGNLYCDLPLLLSVPAVQLAAREVYSVANTEENNDSDVAYVWGLAELAEAVAAAGMPEGHCVELSTQVRIRGGRVGGRVPNNN